jgi:hypothetical protein
MWYVLGLFDGMLKKVLLGLELAYLPRAVIGFESPLFVLAREESIAKVLLFTALAGTAGEVSLWLIQF